MEKKKKKIAGLFENIKPKWPFILKSETEIIDSEKNHWLHENDIKVAFFNFFVLRFFHRLRDVMQCRRLVFWTNTKHV